MKRLKKGSIYYIIIPIVVALIPISYNMITRYEDQKQEEVMQLLELAKDYYEEDNIEGMVAVYSDKRLENNKYANLNLGALYAKGLYFEKDDNMAIKYFYKALKNGEFYYSIMYLITALPYGKNEEKGEITRLIQIGCKNNNKYCEKLLQKLYSKAGLDPVESYLLDFNSKTEKEQQKIIENIYETVGSVDYRVAKEYLYTIYEDENGESQIGAEVTKIEERSIPVEVKRVLNPYKIVFGVGGI